MELSSSSFGALWADFTLALWSSFADSLWTFVVVFIHLDVVLGSLSWKHQHLCDLPCTIPPGSGTRIFSCIWSERSSHPESHGAVLGLLVRYWETNIFEQNSVARYLLFCAEENICRPYQRTPWACKDVSLVVLIPLSLKISVVSLHILCHDEEGHRFLNYRIGPGLSAQLFSFFVVFQREEFHNFCCTKDWCW